MATVEEKVQQLEGQQTASGLILRDHRQRIEAIEEKLGISLPPAPVPEPPPAPAPGPAPAEERPTDAALREIIRGRFIALTVANGYQGGRVPGEEPLGTVVGNAVDQWIALARAELYVEGTTNADALAKLEARIAADVAVYYPPQGTTPTPAPDPVIETPAPAFAYKTRTKRALISLVGSDGDGTGSEARPFRTIRGAMAKMGDDTEYIVRSTDDRQSQSIYSSYGGRTPLKRITIRPETLYGATLRGSAQPEGSIDGNCMTLSGGDRDIELVGFNIDDWMDKWGNGMVSVGGDVDGLRVALLRCRNNGGGSAPYGAVDGHDHLIYLSSGTTRETAPRNMVFEDLDSVGPTDRRIGALLAHLYAASGHGAWNTTFRRCKIRGIGVWGVILSPNYGTAPVNLLFEDNDVEGDFRDAAISFWYGDKGRSLKGGVDATCVFRGGRYVNTTGQQISYPTVTEGGRAHSPTLAIGGSSPAPAPTPAPTPAPAPSPAPVGQDEVPSIALVRDRMTQSKGHEEMPSIAETFPDWGILRNVVYNLEINPQGKAYASNPPHISERASAMGWFVVAGIKDRPNTASNAATRIWLARAFLWLKDGRTLMAEGHDRGSMTLDTGMRWGNDPAATFVDGNQSIIRYVGNKSTQNGIYAGRNWHPTIPRISPGGKLKDSVLASLVAVQFGAVPVDPSLTFDYDRLNNTIYPGDDNYDPQQDGFSGRFLKVQPWKRWAFAFEGDWGVLSSRPPNLPGWAG